MADCARPAGTKISGRLSSAGWSLALEAGCDVHVGLRHAEARPLGPRENVDTRTLQAHQRSCPAGLDFPRDPLRPTTTFALPHDASWGRFALGIGNGRTWVGAEDPTPPPTPATVPLL